MPKTAHIQPPDGIDDNLKNWLSQLTINIDSELNRVHDYPVLYALPNKVYVGMTRYFGAAIPATAIVAEGLWVYKSTGWVQIV